MKPNLHRSARQNRIRSVVLALITTLVAVPVSSATRLRPLAAPKRAHDEVEAATQEQSAEQYGRLPLRFERNVGQTDDQVRFLARGSGYTLFLTETESVFMLQAPRSDAASLDAADTLPTRGDAVPEPSARDRSSAVVRMRLVGSSQSADVAGVDRLPGVTNYLIGNDSSHWHTGIASFAKVRVGDVYPGVDLIYYGNQRQLEYDFAIAPGADPTDIRMTFDGADSVDVDESGDLVVRVGGAELRQHAPLIYQDDSDGQRRIDGRYVVSGARDVGFAIGDYDRHQPLVIDPVLVYSTYLGGNSSDAGLGITVDGAGDAYVAGQAYSSNFPTANPFEGDQGSVDAFVTKLSPAGTALVYCTYLGGSDIDEAQSIAIDTAGAAYVTGWTHSSDFPVGIPIQSYRGGFDVFVTKLNPLGNGLVYSTYLGGATGDEVGLDIALDSARNAYIAGTTRSTDFPTVNAFQTDRPDADAFVAKIAAAGNVLVYSTYLGGTGWDQGQSIALDAAGNAYVTGWTSSTNFPTMSPFQGALQGSVDAFVAKLSPSGNTLVYSTYLDGSTGSAGWGIAVDAAGSAFVTGNTQSSNFPLVNPFEPYQGNGDAFVTKLTPSGNALVYSTFVGGTDADSGLSVAVDGSGDAYVAGWTDSTNFPTAAPVQTDQAVRDAFVLKLAPSGNAPLYSTYLGGNDVEQAESIAVDASGSAYVTGDTLSTNFPTVNPIQGDQPSVDAFILKLADPADLAISISDSPDPLVTGSNLTYTITVTNLGPSVATSVTVSDTLPSIETFVSCTSNGGGVNGGMGNARTVFFAQIAANSVVTITIVANVPCSTSTGRDGTRVSDTASVTSASFDPNLLNNTATTTTTIINPPPSISCPMNILTKANTSTGRIVTYSLPVVTDNCRLASLVCTPPSGSNFPIGTTVVSCKATDAGGAISTCGFTITVTP